MLSTKAIDELKKDWMTFEEIQDLIKTIERIDSWEEKMYSEDEFWLKVKENIVDFHINKEKVA